MATLKCGLEVTKGHPKWYHSKAWVWFPIVTTAVSLAISEIFSIKEWPDLEILVWGRSRSLKLARFDRPYMTFYWSAIVTIALSCTVFELLDDKYRDLEIWLRCHSRSMKLVPFESLGAVPYSPSIVTIAVSVAVCEIYSVKEWCDLENRLEFVQGHWKWHYLIDRTRLPISVT